MPDFPCTTHDVARLLDVPITTINMWLYTKKVDRPAKRLGRQMMWERRDVQRAAAATGRKVAL